MIESALICGLIIGAVIGVAVGSFAEHLTSRTAIRDANERADRAIALRMEADHERDELEQLGALRYAEAMRRLDEHGIVSAIRYMRRNR
jgi:hypothetical protein